MLVALLATAASVLRLSRVMAVGDVDPAALADGLRGAALSRVIAMASLLERDAAPGAAPPWSSELLGDVGSSRHAAERTALVNEHLRALEASLSWGERIPKEAARISLGGSLCALFASLAGGGEVSPWTLAATMAWGLAGSAASLTAGRHAERVASRLRTGVDQLVAKALRAAEEPEPS